MNKQIQMLYGVNPALKIHTGGCVFFGYLMVHCKSSKQNINTKSSTKAKLVGVDHYLPYSIWICLFMGAQGYDIKKNILFQDDQIAVKVEENGKKSCTGNSRQ